MAPSTLQLTGKVAIAPSVHLQYRQNEHYNSFVRVGGMYEYIEYFYMYSYSNFM